MNWRKFWVGTGWAVAIALGVTVAWAASGMGTPRISDEELARNPSVVVRVETAPVGPAEAGSLRAYGTSRARERAVLSFPLAGRLVDRPIEVGQQVRAAQVLARLDPAPFVHAVALARASEQEVERRLEQLSRDRARIERLYAGGVVSQSEFEEISTEEEALVARRAQAVAQLLQARRAQEDSVLRAPYAGVVSAVHLMPREFAAPGAPVVQISGQSGLEVKVQIAEGSRQGLSTETPVSVDFPLIGLRGVPGVISQLGEDGERAGGLFPVVVRVDREGLSAGLSAEVVFPTAPPEGLSVPLEAVVNRTGRVPSVFRLGGDDAGGRIAERVPVRLVDLRGDRLIVESVTARGLALGDEVITRGQAGLSSRTHVEVK